MNKLFLQDIVKGQYGRKIAYTDVDQITTENILKVVGKTIGIFNMNRQVVKYLWDYKNGDQPILYREKTVRDDILNCVVENHAWEIVQFKNAQTYGEPIQYVSKKDDEAISKAVDKLNDYVVSAGKQVKDISSGEWTSAVGTGFKCAQRKNGEIPFRITVPTPMNTYIIYSRMTEEPMLAVQQLKDEDGVQYLLCFDDKYQYIIKNGALVSFDAETEIYRQLHMFAGIPIVEYPNNQDRISDIELVISMLDAINNMQSNRMDAVEQFVQSWVKFINCDIDAETFAEMKKQGALMVKSTKDKQADVELMTQELNQTQTQVAKQDLWDNVLSISAIPNKQGNTGGDTQGAVELRNGWDFSKSRAKLKDPYIIDAERQLIKVILGCIDSQLPNADKLNLSVMDFDITINHSPLDNLQVKAQVYQILVNNGIHPLIAMKTSGMWADVEKVFSMSQEYLDNFLKKNVPDAQQQEQKAQEIVKNVENR